MDRTRSPLDRLSDDVVLCLFSRAPFTTHGQLQVVCRRLRTLVRSREFLQQRVGSGLVEHGLVVAGGWRDGGRITAGCSAFTCGRWRPIAPMSSPRAHACSAIVEDDEDGQPEMWVMGGYGRWDDLATVEAYNPRTNEWRSCLSLRQGRQDAVAGVVGGRLVVAGGCAICADGVRRLTSVEAYSPSGWAPLPPLPHAANNATACVLEGRLYVMGGNECNKLQVLEMSKENVFTWSVKADLPADRSDAASVAHEGKIWLIGGTADRVVTTSVLIYDIDADSWGTGPALPWAAYGPRAAKLNGEIYVLRKDGYWVYRGTAWVDVPGGPGFGYAECSSVRLG